MPVLPDVASFTSGTGSGSLTWPHTCTGTGTDGILVVGAGCAQGPPSANVVSATYNGVAMTPITGFSATDGTFVKIRGFYLLLPPTGVHNVVVNYGGSEDMVGAGAASFTGVDQVTPLGTAQATGASGTAAATASPVASAVGDIVIGAIASDSDGVNAITINGAGTSLWEVEGVGSDADFAMGTWAGASSVAVGWTQNNTGYAVAGVSIKAAGGGGGAAQVPYQPQYQSAPVMAQ